MHWTWPWPRITSSDKSSKYFLPLTKRLVLVSPPREEWPFTPFSLSRHSLILLHLVSRRGHMSSPDRETRVLGNKQKTGMFSTFCLHLLFIWGVLGLNQLTRFISRGINWGSAQQALPSVHHQLSLIWRRGSQDFRYSSKKVEIVLSSLVMVNPDRPKIDLVLSSVPYISILWMESDMHLGWPWKSHMNAWMREILWWRKAQNATQEKSGWKTLPKKSKLICI